MPTNSDRTLQDSDWSDDEDGADDSVTLIDPDGNEFKYIFLLVIDLDDAGKFAALTPVDQNEEDENIEVFLFHYSLDDDDFEIFNGVTDDDLFTRVMTAVEECLAGQDAADQAELASYGTSSTAEVDLVRNPEQLVHSGPTYI